MYDSRVVRFGRADSKFGSARSLATFEWMTLQRCTVAIKPNTPRAIYRTMVSIAAASHTKVLNRSLPDGELDAFVALLAMRISTFDKQAIAETKHLVDIASLPPDSEIAAGWDACIASMQRPPAQEKIKRLLELGLQKNADVEARLPYYTRTLGSK
jgi:hypothetical protein